MELSNIGDLKTRICQCWWAVLFKLMMPKSSVGSLVQSEVLDDLVGPAR